MYYVHFLVTNITCLTSEQQPAPDGGTFHPSTRPHDPRRNWDVHQRLQSRKMRRERNQKELKAMKYNQSLLKRNPSCYLECTVLYKRYRSLALNIGLFGGRRKKRKKERKLAKMSFGTNGIFTVFKVPFLQREKKVLQRQGIGLLVGFR